MAVPQAVAEDARVEAVVPTARQGAWAAARLLGFLVPVLVVNQAAVAISTDQATVMVAAAAQAVKEGTGMAGATIMMPDQAWGQAMATVTATTDKIPTATVMPVQMATVITNREVSEGKNSFLLTACIYRSIKEPV